MGITKIAKTELNLKAIYERLLTITPFILFGVSGFFKLESAQGLASSISSLTIAFKIISYIVIFFTFVSIVFKRYDKDWMFAWVGFFLYFIWFFIIPPPESGSSLYVKFFAFLIPNDIETLSYLGFFPYSKSLFVVFFFNVLLILLLEKLNIKMSCIYILIFTYFFSFCNLSIFHYYTASVFQLEAENILIAMKTFLILNSLFAVGFLIALKRIQKRLMVFFAFLLYLVLNFLSLNCFQMVEIFNSTGLPNNVTIADRFIDLLKFYFKNYIVVSNVLFYLAFFLIKPLVEKAVVARQKSIRE